MAGIVIDEHFDEVMPPSTFIFVLDDITLSITRTVVPGLLFRAGFTTRTLYTCNKISAILGLSQFQSDIKRICVELGASHWPPQPTDKIRPNNSTPRNE